MDAFDVAEFLGAFHAAVAGDVEERVVHRLGHAANLSFSPAPAGTASIVAGERRENCTLHAFPPPLYS
jgi:hypothetical protein